MRTAHSGPLTGRSPSGRRKPSPRTDATEQALRRWIVQRNYRPGDRLPADIELAQMLGVARSTVIAALDRLEAGGIIRRRQGSGTFVEQAPLPQGVRPGIEVLGTEGDAVRRQGLDVTLLRADVATAVAAGAEVSEALQVPPGTPVTRVSRVLGDAGRPCALLTDHIRADAGLPDPEELAERLSHGGTMLAILLDAGLPVAYAQTSIRPLTVAPDDDAGIALALDGPSAALEVRETTHLASGQVVRHSVDLVLPSGWELNVFRHLSSGSASRPAPLPPRSMARTA